MKTITSMLLWKSPAYECEFVHVRTCPLHGASSCVLELVVDTTSWGVVLHAFCLKKRQEMLIRRQSTALVFTRRKEIPFYCHAHVSPL